MRNRVDKLGVASPEIREQSPDQIVIQLAGIHNPEQAAQIIGKTAELELYDLTPALVPPSVTARGDAARADHEPLPASERRPVESGDGHADAATSCSGRCT